MDVIHIKNLPTRLPIQSTAIAYLLLCQFHVPEWVRGATWTIFVILWIFSICAMASEKYTTLEELRRR